MSETSAELHRSVDKSEGNSADREGLPDSRGGTGASGAADWKLSVSGAYRVGKDAHCGGDARRLC